MMGLPFWRRSAWLLRGRMVAWLPVLPSGGVGVPVRRAAKPVFPEGLRECEVDRRRGGGSTLMHRSSSAGDNARSYRGVVTAMPRLPELCCGEWYLPIPAGYGPVTGLPSWEARGADWAPKLGTLGEGSVRRSGACV